jgi:CRP/FNR family transcriptional regulator, cyclic AMP receptor protein
MKVVRDGNMFPVFGLGTSLAELDALSLEAITKAAIRHTINKGEIVCLEGEPCPGLMIVESGWLRGVKTSPQGREQETRSAGPGEMLNEVSVMAGGNNLVTVKSLESSVVWLIGREVLFDLMAKHPLLSNTITHNLAKHVVHLLNLVEDLALRNVDGRLAHLLLDSSKDGIIHRHNWSTQAEMAACIGTTPEIVSRVLNELEDRGAIRLERHQIFILDREILESVEFQKYK